MGVSSAGSFFVRQHIVGVGTDLVIIGGVFVGMDDGFVFTMDTHVHRFLFQTKLFEVYCLRPGWRNREW